jgi:predicted MPP superfamily phosphohydrolase
MWARFWFSAVLFHITFGTACVVVLRRWMQRIETALPSGACLTALVGDAAMLMVTALVSAAAASLIGATSGFGFLRLLSQGLFGEIVLLTSVLPLLLLRSGARRIAALALAVPASLIGVYAEAYHHEPHDLHVRRHAVDLGRFKGRPLRILHISDIQTDDVTEYEEHVFREAIALQPDLVVLTGDYVQPRLVGTRTRATIALKRLLQELSSTAPLGAYAVRGDVDVEWPSVVSDTGVRALTGESVRVTTADGHTVTLIGVTSGMSRGDNDAALADLVRNTPPADVRIVFGHNPNFVESLREIGARADLVLAGHTHGGQVVLPWLGAPITKMNLPREYASGLHDYGGTPLHVSAGVGMERQAAPQIRFGCPPEICLLELR